VERDAQVAIIGAGPYGLSCAAFLRHSGIETQVFGEPMGFWRSRMPRGMLLRSRRRSSHIADPRLALTIDRYEDSTGASLSEPIELRHFLGYSDWFRRHAAPEVDRRRVQRIDRVEEGFKLTLGDGQATGASRVVVAAGLEPFAWRPAPLGELPRHLVSHSSDHVELSALSGKRVLVVGAGQSALESAALLHESGAEVEIVARALGIHWLAGDQPGVRPRIRRLMMPPTDVGGKVTGWMAAAPELLRRVPGRVRPEVTRRCIVPAGAAWLRSRLEQVPMTLGRSVAQAEPAAGGVRVTLDDGSIREPDHVLLATGFRVDVREYPFLSAELASDLDLLRGYPRLGPGLESRVPGLHFVGAPAMLSYGPLMRFVVGTWHAAPALAASVLGGRQRLVRLSYKPRITLRRRDAITHPAIGGRVRPYAGHQRRSPPVSGSNGDRQEVGAPQESFESMVTSQGASELR
jgi:hypothetical protein